MSRLAILGGTPVFEQLPDYTRWPRGGEKEKEALLRTLHSGVWGGLGEENRRFSEAYAAYCQTRYALPVLNGTVSLELIFRALGIGYGDEVIVPPYTFSASVHSIALCGAMPVFADIDPETFNLDSASVEQRITPRTRAILGVHLGGRMFDADALGGIAQRHGLYLIEDAAHAQGSEWKGCRAGSLGAAGSFSFQATKNICSGEGGAITTNDPALYEKLWSLHAGGCAFGAEQEEHSWLGTNARLSEWQCAILLARLERLDGDIELRMKNAAYLDKQLSELPYFRALRADERITRHSMHLYCFRYLPEGLDGLPRRIFIKALAAELGNVVCEGYCDPIYEMAMLYSDDFQKMTGRTFVNPREMLPGNERIAHAEGCWMTHSSLLGPQQDMDRIVEAFAKVGSGADELRKAFGQEEQK